MPTDFSSGSPASLRHTLHTLGPEGGRVVVLHELDVHQARGAGLRCDVALTHGVPFQQILDHAHDREVDLIVTGIQGRTGLQHMFLGSVAEKVVRLAPCPVLVVHSQHA